MIYQPVRVLNVWLDAWSRHQFVGRLGLRNRQILFEYDPVFLTSGVEISPLNLPGLPGVVVGDRTVFEGLPGVFNDSLPDGWGRLLLDRALERHGVNRGELCVLDRLAYVGRHGMGALSYEPERGEHPQPEGFLELDKLAEESARVLAGEDAEVLEELLQLNGSSGGACPKIVAQVSADRKRIVHGQQDLQQGYTPWLIKFASSQDSRDAAAIEYAYSLMARDAGVEMPETHLFRSKKGRYFGVQRFDRRGAGRIHMHSLGGLIQADHRVPSLDYSTLLQVTQSLTRRYGEVVRAYTLAVFNVLAHNRDDHAKNISFLLNERGEWHLAPAYDLTFSSGPGGEQSMLVMGEGRAPGPTQLRELAKKHGVEKPDAILTRVREAVARWPKHAKQAGVSAASVKAITARLVQIDHQK